MLLPGRALSLRVFPVTPSETPRTSGPCSEEPWVFVHVSVRLLVQQREEGGRFWVSIATAPVSPHCSRRFERLLVQIYMYLHVINIEAESELVWATIPGQLRLLFSHPA